MASCTAQSAFDPKRTCLLRANDGHRVSSLVVFSFLIATLFVFLLSKCLTFRMHRF